MDRVLRQVIPSPCTSQYLCRSNVAWQWISTDHNWIWWQWRVGVTLSSLTVIWEREVMKAAFFYSFSCITLEEDPRDPGLLCQRHCNYYLDP